MKKENIIRKPKEDTKSIPLCIKISKNQSDWLKEQNFSPTSLFNEACKDLGYKE